jgi:hypothetical protein
LGDSVKGQPSVDDERTCVFAALRPGATKGRVIAKQPACLLNAFIEPISDRLRVPLGDVKPDVEQILARGR